MIREYAYSNWFTIGPAQANEAGNRVTTSRDNESLENTEEQ